jgi:SprT protein
MSRPQRKAPRQPAPSHYWEQREFEFTPPPAEPAELPDISKLADTARRLLELQGARSLIERVTVVWNGRLQTTAGTADIRTSTIELNPRLAEFGMSQIQRTLRHEAAHLLAHWRAGRKRIETHGAEWRQACADLGIPGEAAFHDLPWQRRKVKRRYAYTCPACGFIAWRVRPFERYTACYKCCRKWNNGVYHAKFQFVKMPIKWNGGAS